MSYLSEPIASHSELTMERRLPQRLTCSHSTTGVCWVVVGCSCLLRQDVCLFGMLNRTTRLLKQPCRAIVVEKQRSGCSGIINH